MWRNKLLVAFYAFCLTLTCGIWFAQSQGFQFPPGALFTNYAGVGGLIPTCASGCTITSGSTDMAGSASITATATPGVVTWATAKNKVPFCVAANATSFEPASAVVTVTNITIKGTTADVIVWMCLNIVGN